MPGLVLQAHEHQIHPNERTADTIKVGFTVTKRVGNSVVRNRVRRRLRAAANVVIQKHAAKGNDYVIIGRVGTAQRNFDGLVKDLEISLSYVLKFIVLLMIGSPPIKTLFIPPIIDFKIDGTPGRQKTFST